MGNNFYFYPICISNQQILLQSSELLSELLAQAVASADRFFRLLIAALFSRKQLNASKSLPPSPALDRPLS